MKIIASPLRQLPAVGHNQPSMMLIAGISLLIVAIAVKVVHEGVTVSHEDKESENASTANA
ncbi:MAG: hypothetical protein SOV68_07980 [Ligilactobacillus salivarius]|nr:hypothetical protein [Ligilactobacillus salivarius]